MSQLGTPPLIKEEQVEEDEEAQAEDDVVRGGYTRGRKPTIENILSSSEDEPDESEESLSGFEEDQGVQRPQPQKKQDTSSTTRAPPPLPQHPHHKRAPEPRKKREAFTLRQKLEVLKWLEAHCSVNATSRYFKVDPKSIRLWRSQKTKIEEMVQEELVAMEQGDIDGLIPRKRISGAGRNEKVIVEIEENPNKRHRRSIKLSDKVEIIRLVENGQTQSDVARCLGISQSTVQTIWSNKEDILERNLCPKKKKKNLHWKKYGGIEAALFSWCKECKDAGIPLDTKSLRDKAIEYAEYYKQREFEIQAVRWIEMFKRKHNLSVVERQDGFESRSQSNLHYTTQGNHNHQLVQNDIVQDFDLGSLPGFIGGLYNQNPHQEPTHPQPNFNSHLPAVPVHGAPVTTCDAMKYIELVRGWIAGTFGPGEELLNSHLNAVENAILKKRMSEIVNPGSR